MSKPKVSQQELLEQAARLVAGTINPEAMGLKPEDINLEQFIELFTKKAEEVLQKKERIFLAVGPYLNIKGLTFTDDLGIIIQFIEEQTQIKFQFFNGILVYLGREDIVAGWMPDRPF